ncbi:MAG TPA: WD40 repeat domain-containing serine/threonine protein kinase [Thermoanaerobaculia bacterium]|nr:WD40 repeat domain-containing serine/threonine protein kinase [Thermoanaerobaculia bacterium]
MTLSSGTRLGPYEILSPLGSGGMGQVYLARDDRLAREVALKVLPEDVASDPARLKRFENEARAASALNHPNIVTIYDVGTSASIAWIAMERVDGKTLRELMARDRLPIRKLLPIAVQIAQGLARAHEAGIVHRDLKPENVMATKEGLVKILDFGVAKLAPGGPVDPGGSQAPIQTATYPGTVVGTIAYMSPEQAAGQAIDFRSDQFSFGAVLYEMTTGTRAFQGNSAVDTLAAVLREDPPPIEALSPEAPAPLRWIIERCLSKEPGRRYASTHDLARDLETLKDHSSEAIRAAPAAAVEPRRRSVAALLVAAAILAGLAGTYTLGRRANDRSQPEFQRLTFRRGVVSSARFAPDDRTVVYSAQWNSDPTRLFSTRTDGRESTRLALPDAALVSMSSLGEMALSLNGTLARAPLAGGAPRELFEGVTEADWSPDGKSLAIVRQVGDKARLEYPPGKLLVESDGPIRTPRVSPNGTRIAFFSGGDAIVSVEMVDLSGRRTALTPAWKRANGLAWSADGSEVWFSANESGWRTPLYAVTPGGKRRVVLQLPSWIVLQDVARDGRALMSLFSMHSEMRVRVAGESRERDLSWHEGSFAKAMTPDGKTLLFDEGAEGSFHAIYVRPTDGSPAKLLGEGRSMAISPDGRWVAANANERGSDLLLLPTGAGEPKVLDTGGRHFDEGVFFPDSRRLLLWGDAPCVLDIATGKRTDIADDRSSCTAVSPNGREAACVNAQGEGRIYAVEGGASRPIPGFEKGEEVLQWSADGRALFVRPNSNMPMRVSRLDLATGKRELWREFSSEDRFSPTNELNYFTMTPDAGSYAYSYFNVPTDLYLVTGLR